MARIDPVYLTIANDEESGTTLPNVRVNSTNRDSERKYAPMIDITRDEMDAKIAAAEARTDTKFASLLGEIKLLSGKVDNTNSELSNMRTDMHRTRDTVRNSGFALAGLIVAVAALLLATIFALPSIYGLGTSTRDIIQSEVQRATAAKPAGQ